MCLGAAEGMGFPQQVEVAAAHERERKRSDALQDTWG